MQIQRVLDFVEENAISAVFTVTVIVTDEDNNLIGRKESHISGPLLAQHIRNSKSIEFHIPFECSFPEKGLFRITASLDQNKPQPEVCKMPFHPAYFVVNASNENRGKRKMEDKKQNWIQMDEQGCIYRYEIQNPQYHIMHIIIQDYEWFLSQIPTST